jgi:hypothetical protein
MIFFREDTFGINLFASINFEISRLIFKMLFEIDLTKYYFKDSSKI